MDQFTALLNAKTLQKQDNRETIGLSGLFHTAIAGEALGASFNTWSFL